MTPEAFFTLHRDLPREGAGEAADVAFAADAVGLKSNAEIVDVACGPGADVAALLAAAPRGHVTALDKMPHFVKAARAIWAADERVTVLKADMARIANTYDLIWCAGAVYFLGVKNALTAWRKVLRPGGAIAFSEPCWFTGTPSARAVALWNRDYPAITDAAGIADQIAEAGYELLATKPLGDQAWENYYTPMQERIAALRPDAEADLTAILDEAEEEIACWRAHRKEFGYLLHVVRPA